MKKNGHRTIRSCDDKRVFQTEEQAWTAINDLRLDKEHPKRAQRMTPYYCSRHYAFHIGHAPTPWRTKRLRKRDRRDA